MSVRKFFSHGVYVDVQVIREFVVKRQQTKSGPQGVVMKTESISSEKKARKKERERRFWQKLGTHLDVSTASSVSFVISMAVNQITGPNESPLMPYSYQYRRKCDSGEDSQSLGCT